MQKDTRESRPCAVGGSTILRTTHGHRSQTCNIPEAVSPLEWSTRGSLLLVETTGGPVYAMSNISTRKLVNGSFLQNISTNYTAIFLKWRYIFIVYKWLATEFKCSNPSSIFSLTSQESLFRKSLYIWNCGRHSIFEARAEQQLGSRRSQTFEMLLCVV